jgi:hypothetical protein
MSGGPSLDPVARHKRALHKCTISGAKSFTFEVSILTPSENFSGLTLPSSRKDAGLCLYYIPKVQLSYTRDQHPRREGPELHEVRRLAGEAGLGREGERDQLPPL